MAICKRDGHYYTDFYVHGKRIRKKISAKRKDIAEQYAADLQVKYVKGLTSAWDSSAQLADLVERYLEYSKTGNAARDHGAPYPRMPCAKPHVTARLPASSFARPAASV